MCEAEQTMFSYVGYMVDVVTDNKTVKHTVTQIYALTPTFAPPTDTSFVQ